jgi:putative chitinase
MLNLEVLSKLAPRPKAPGEKQKNWDNYTSALVSPQAKALFAKFGINTKLRMAHWLGQVLHESGGLTIVWENGNYSAKRIVQIFGVGHHSARVTAAEASRLAYNGPALFDRVYGLGNPRKAKELGNTQKGDGWRYRGCGIVQLTGRAAHERYAEEIGCAVADLEKPINAIHGALLEWKEKNCNAAADKDDIVLVTKKVNGGRNGLEDRRIYLARAKRLLMTLDTDAPLPVDEPVAEDVPVAAEEPVKTPAAALAAVSRKATWLVRFGHACKAAFGSLTLGALAEQAGVAKSTMDQVSQFIQQHAIVILITCAILGYFAIKYVLALMAEDVDQGRYTPSGEAA